MSQSGNSEHVQITSSTAETEILPADGANSYRNIHRLVISNISAVDTVVTIRDSPGGRVVERFNVVAGANAGFVMDSKDAVKQTVRGSAWTAQCGTSVASIDITSQFVTQA